MSSGKVHNRASMGMALISATAMIQYPSNIVLPIAGGCMLGIILTPDWDLDAGSNSNAHARKLKIGMFFNTLIKPYSLAYKHRSNQSHLPIISTVGRLIYLLVPFIVLFTANQPTSKIRLFWYCLFAQLMALPLWILTFYFYLSPQYDNVLFYIFIGLCLSDMLHWLFDNFSKIL